jgi:hypothetical protein
MNASPEPGERGDTLLKSETCTCIPTALGHDTTRRAEAVRAATSWPAPSTRRAAWRRARTGENGRTSRPAAPPETRASSNQSEHRPTYPEGGAEPRRSWTRCARTVYPLSKGDRVSCRRSGDATFAVLSSRCGDDRLDCTCSRHDLRHLSAGVAVLQSTRRSPLRSVEGRSCSSRSWLLSSHNDHELISAPKDARRTDGTGQLSATNRLSVMGC